MTGAIHRERASASLDDLLGLAGTVARTLGERRLTLFTAESCTGGLVAHLLTEISGSSAWFLGGAVVYSDALKRALVDVPTTLLEQHGAVSAEVARAMAVGARERFGSDLALSVTGIAGPTGATPTKPVGLVYLGVANAVGVRVDRHVWDGDRSANKCQSADAVLRLLLQVVG